MGNPLILQKTGAILYTLTKKKEARENESTLI